MKLESYNLEDIYQRVYEQLLESNRKWKFDGFKALPTLEDVQLLVDKMIQDVREDAGSISVESGGILVKRTEDYIDIYVHVGGIK